MSRIDVIMPQMGESITEGTIVRWHRQPGEPIAEGETLLEISTAKVEVEIPAPSSGTVAELLFAEGATVPIDTVIATLAPVGERVDAATPVTHSANGREAKAPVAPAPARVALPPAAHADETAVEIERQRLLKRRSSPLVRKMALAHGVDVTQIAGSGVQGRVTSRDLELYLAERAAAADRPGEPRPLVASGGPSETPDILPMSAMRRSIADNLLRSMRTIPHAYTVHEIDFTALEELRALHKADIEGREGIRLTPLVFLVKACADALLEVPAVNASWRNDHIEANRTANIGIAVAVKDGLLVPVLKRVETLSISQVARGIAELADRARTGRLKPADLQGGTFSISSPGQLGALFAIPIINQQQGAILHFGAIHKVPAVVTDADGRDTIAVRKHAMLTLGIDHRLVDGWEADTFMTAVRRRIEPAQFAVK